MTRRTARAQEPVPKKNPKQVAYRLLLRNARGFSSLRAARYFKIYYGRKPVSVWIEFPKRAKTVAQKRKGLVALFTDIENRRQNILEARRFKTQARRAVEKARVEEKKSKKEKKQIKDFLSKEKLNVKKRRFEDPKFGTERGKQRVKGKIKITPVITHTRLYKKEIIYKTVDSPNWDLLYLKILDFTLKEPIAMHRGNVEEVKLRIAELFKPHLIKFFAESVGTRRGFLFRLKYNMTMPDGSVQKSGIGGGRFYVTSIKDLKGFEFLAQISYELLKTEMMERYLSQAMGGSIDITGFTIENIVKGAFP